MSMLALYASDYNNENDNSTKTTTSKNKTRKSKENLIKMKDILNKREKFEQNEMVENQEKNNENDSDNENDGLANFTPLDESFVPNNSTTYNQMLQPRNVVDKKDVQSMNSDYQGKFIENFEKLKDDKQLNIKSYENSYLPYYNKMSHNTDNMTKSELIQKLDYIINLLEDEKTIKTGHVTEELILYCFLGVFIIFIVDSFARTGKYRR